MNNNNIQSYQNNPNLKHSGVGLSFTNEQIKEITKCSGDCVYFLDNYFKQVTLDEGLQAIKLWPTQKKVLKKLQKNRFVIIKQPRQTAKTTTIVGYILWCILFTPHFGAAILANKETIAIDILSRLQLAYENLPLWIQQGVIGWASKSIDLENGSSVIAEATSSSAIRGMVKNLVFLDELAFIEPNVAENFYTSVYPTISSGKTSKFIIASTPNGIGNLYYRLFRGAELGHNGFTPINIHYSEIPGRTKQWAKEQLKMLGQRRYDQEVECNWLGSSGTLIAGPTLRNLMWSSPANSADEHLLIWEEPIKGHLYILCADTAEGTQQDSSAFIVFDVTSMPYKQVARYRNNEIAPELYPFIIVQSAKWYNNAYVLIENNNQGGLVGHIIVNELEYDNLFWERPEINLDHTIGQDNKSNRIGLYTTKKSKMMGCMSLKTLIENEQLKLQDEVTIQELSVFVLSKTGSYAAEEGYNDDLAMCLVFFAWLTKQPFFKDISNVDLRGKLWPNKMKEMEDAMPLMPVVTSTPAMDIRGFGRTVGNGSDLYNNLYKEPTDGLIWEIVGVDDKSYPVGVGDDPNADPGMDIYASFFTNFGKD